jgi:hypothetical protein
MDTLKDGDILGVLAVLGEAVYGVRHDNAPPPRLEAIGNKSPMKNFNSKTYPEASLARCAR